MIENNLDYYIKFKHNYFDDLEKNLRTNFFSLNKQLDFLNDCIKSFVLHLYLRIIENLDIKHLNKNESYGLALTKQIIKTNLLIKNLLYKSLYYDINVLNRKQLESVTRLHELSKTENLKISKTPNTSNTFKQSFNELKKHLSEFVHVTNSDKIEQLNLHDKNFKSEFDSKYVNSILSEQIQINFSVMIGIFNLLQTKIPNVEKEMKDSKIVFEFCKDELLKNKK